MENTVQNREVKLDAKFVDGYEEKWVSWCNLNEKYQIPSDIKITQVKGDGKGDQYLSFLSEWLDVICIFLSWSTFKSLKPKNKKGNTCVAITYVKESDTYFYASNVDDNDEKKVNDQSFKFMERR